MLALAYDRDTGNYDLIDPRRRAVRQKCNRKNSEQDGNLILGVLQKREPKMTEKRGRGQPKFEPTHDQRSQVKLMKALGNTRGPDLQDYHQPADQEARCPDDAGAGIRHRA